MSKQDESNDKTPLSPEVDITQAALSDEDLLAKGSDNKATIEFFANIDRELNKNILDYDEKQVEEIDKEEAAKTQELKDTTQQPAESSPDDVETLKKRYASSSTEAKRLNEQLKSIEPYMPILNAMKEDPGLISHVRGYFEGGGQTPQSIIESMNLGDDFTMDMNEAVNDPNSDSAKVFNATVENMVSQRLQQALTKQAQQTELSRQEEEFRRNNKVSDEEWNNFKSEAKRRKLSLEDLWYIYKREDRDRQIAKDVSKQTMDKMKKVQERPKSLANIGSEKQPERSPSDKVMDALVEIDRAQDIVKFTD